MALQASDRELKKAFETHAVETAGHVDRLHRVFRAIGAKPRHSGTTEGLAGIIADSENLLKRKVDPDVRDAWLIATAQRIEHLEISAYGTARTYAEMLAFERAAQLLQETLEEERTTDEKLTRLARGIRQSAVDQVGAGALTSRRGAGRWVHHVGSSPNIGAGFNRHQTVSEDV